MSPFPRRIGTASRAALVGLLVALAVAWGASAASSDPRDRIPYPVPEPPPPPSSQSLGATLVNNSASWARLLQRSRSAGALVISVLPGSAAEGGRVAPGDVITAIDGIAVPDADRATYLLRSSRSISHVLSLAKRDGTAQATDVNMSTPLLTHGEYLRRRMAEDPDIITRYLYAQSATSPAVARSLADSLVRDVPNFGPAHSLQALKLLEAVASENKSPLPETFQSATDAIAQAIEIDPDSADIRNDASLIFLSLNMPAESEAAARETLKNDEGSVNGNRLLGLALLTRRQPEAALPYLHRAVELNPYVPTYYTDLAKTYEVLGWSEAAVMTRNTGQEVMNGRFGRENTRVVPVALAVAIASLITSLAIVVSWKRFPPAPTVGLFSISRINEMIVLVEALVVLGAWAAAIPLISPALGLAPETTARLEIVDHVVPGIIIVLISMGSLLKLLSDESKQDFLQIAFISVLLAGLWITSTHIPLLAQGFRHEKPWSLALFHSSVGPPIMLLSILAYRQVSRQRPATAIAGVLE